MYTETLRKLGYVGIVLGCLFALGCNSSNTSGGGEADTSDIAVSDDSFGTLSLSVNSTTMAIGGTSGFLVRVRDAAGAPVPNVQISCDTEQGLALVEPTTGIESTDGYGNMSGVVGCEAPGSFRIGCRGPIGLNRRDFVSVKCEGDVPAEFSGFPGAGGGSLGGGVDTSDEQGNTAFGIRLTEISFQDDGTDTATTSIDITQSVCRDGTAEPFFDTSMRFGVVNNSNQVVRFTRFTYTVSNFDGAGNSHTSPTLTFIGEAQSLDADGGKGEFNALFADAESGGKRFFGRADNITSAGFKNISFTLVGTNSAGETVTVSGRSAASFDNFLRCP